MTSLMLVNSSHNITTELFDVRHVSNDCIRAVNMYFVKEWFTSHNSIMSNFFILADHITSYNICLKTCAHHFHWNYHIVFKVYLIIIAVWLGPDPPENCHMNVKKLPKNCLFFQNVKYFGKFWHSNVNFPFILLGRNCARFEKKDNLWVFFPKQLSVNLDSFTNDFKTQRFVQFVVDLT